jgi:hypothetical protein
MKIRSYTENLSDGSEVTNVILEDGEGCPAQIELLACSADDATMLIDKLTTAILMHTVTNVVVRW